MRVYRCFAATLACLLYLTCIHGAQAQTADEYWSFAADKASVMNSRWSESAGAFFPYNGPADTRMNANMLDLYALAALQLSLIHI